MVTLAGLEPATSPAPGEQGRSIPLELQRRHDLHDRLWRRRGGGIGSTDRARMPEGRFPLPWSVEEITLRASKEDPPRESDAAGKVRKLCDETHKAYN